MEKTKDGSFVKDGKSIWEPQSEKVKEACKKRGDEFDQHRIAREEGDPCFKEGQMAMDCLKANMYNKSKCELEFENTRACKKFWGKIRRQRIVKGQRPFIPDIEDREEVKKEYAHFLKT
ncbi:coiled-coil-helix-coiled-coil-helix domain-containing protein 7-like [Crassostrea virginica]|uniref:Coiled-coil-helix-coiled-coil-helix domain-containing protein 7 n=1 Tax=Crassostrea virginica TaxID=6565 RepID=A0A8B8CNS6_CRAVI|nr:coiled-coil-helix-coiled-coil-helix domain-containing protein 7-like [Crassostrea virginica]XP_022317462.1 coiled-coil-helix-coiled-coil-helix domain-containing protein 7-like [Crassostrea virginica]|mmetsp:Transcript_19993/g.33032  ORF Transcript_19993/g.33032 Transcript_19993/m.33032 type:complete len:119 (+) Transcript_19993:76-432(+)